jgi:hypothetical protein
MDICVPQPPRNESSDFNTTKALISGAFAVFGASYSTKAESILVRLLQDRDGVVRACACDSLIFIKFQEVLL